MNNELISIITASYNYENYIKETIESVISQTYTNWEMIILDDGSKDNSVDVIRNYCLKDSRIKLYQHHNNENKGLAETLKLGLEKAKGEWIIFLESDDSITPDYIEKKLQVIKEYPDIKFIFNDVNCFGDNSRVKEMEKYFISQKSKIIQNPNPRNFLCDFEEFNIIPTFSTVMLKKEILKDIDYNSPLKKILDYYLWTQIALNNEFYYINQKLTNWRMHPNSYISTSCNKQDKVIFDIAILNIICKKENKLKYLHKYIHLYRKMIFRIFFKQQKILLFGKWYSFKNILHIKSINY